MVDLAQSVGHLTGRAEQLEQPYITVVRQLVRSSRWRQAFVWGCVPYLVLSLFAGFLHVHPLLDRAPSAGTVHGAIFAPAPSAARIPESSCAICQWQRVGPRLQAGIAVGPATIAPSIPIAAIAASVPQSPIPHSASLRGPPFSLFV